MWARYQFLLMLTWIRWGSVLPALSSFLEENTERRGDDVFNTKVRPQNICLRPHAYFWISCRIAEIAEICSDWGIALVEDAAESLGSFVNSQHTGTFSSLATLSFNGNKVITTGGGGMITNDSELASRAKHITTTAKIQHSYDFVHDEVGYNYRLPNLNAALGCAQMERLNEYLAKKADLADRWNTFFGQKMSTS